MHRHINLSHAYNLRLKYATASELNCCENVILAYHKKKVQKKEEGEQLILAKQVNR